MTSALLAPSPPIAAPARPSLHRTGYEPRPGEPPTTVVAPAPDRPTEVVAPPPPDEQPGARAAIVRVLRLACEVLDGRRPPAHLAGHVDIPALRYWRAAAGQRRTRSPARFARIRLCHPRPDAAEVAVTLELDGRARALAARFELAEGRWRCRTLRLG